MLDQLKKVYIEELQQANYNVKNTPEENASKMFAAIERNAMAGGRNQWMPYNACLKKACKQVGIKTDKELRNLFVMANMPY